MTDLPDLTACDREPIHIPGSIQPHGVLIVVDARTRAILQVSENAADVLGVDPAAVLDAPLDEVVTLPADLFDDDERPAHSAWVPVTFPNATKPAAWYASVHAYDTRWMIEFEPRDSHFEDDPFRVGYDLTHKLELDSNVERAAARVARTVRNLLGYDRVMVYRFDHDWHGEVVAEARKEDLEAYLGLHYPATDIPVQARALYLRNRVRQISDCRYVPARILPAYDPDTAAATDLSDVSLRSVSPVHLEYLGNMGVTGTLVASIIANGKLWGLIACHHYSPFFADHRMREVADAVARAFASRVAAIEELAKIESESILLTVREKLITAFNERDRIDPELLASLAPELLEVVDADGIAIFAGNRVMRHGQLPEEAALLRIRDFVGTGVAQDVDGITGVLHTDQIGTRYPDLADPAVASLAAGIIFMPLQSDAHNAVVWTRAEQVRNVRWAGNPTLSKLEVYPGARLSPRQSFATWQENVRGSSRPWSRQHLESARGLRVLIEMMERKHFQQSFALMRASLARLPDPIVITDASQDDWRECIVVFVNDAFVHKTHRSAESVTGLSMTALIGESAEALATLATSVDARDAASVVVPLRHSDGSLLKARVELEPVADAVGSITHWMSVFHFGVNVWAPAMTPTALRRYNIPMTDRVRLFQTLPHTCGYFAERTAQNLVVDPGAPNLDKLYGPALAKGFRRAGGHLYLPQCAACQACVPCRIDVERFTPDRAQRRCLKRNADLTIREGIPGFTPDRHELYERYLRARHSGGGMDGADEEDFQRFLAAPWSPTLFLEYYLGDRLLGVAVTDIALAGVSAVYTFFDPDEEARGLGTFGILQQVELARRRGIPYVYLGFWIAGHPKMDYKRRFRPLEIRRHGRWIEMP